MIDFWHYCIFGRKLDRSSWLVPCSLSVVIYFALFVGANGNFDHYDSDENNEHMCYSCMTQDKEEAWSYLQYVYYRPANFTNHCNRPMVTYGIGVRPCTSSCVVITEMRIVSGHFAGYSVTRGCINSIAKNGFRNTTLRDYHFELRPTCERLPRNALFYKSNPTIEDQVYFCTCFGDRCNDDRGNAAVSYHVLPFYELLDFSRFVLPVWNSHTPFLFILLLLRSLAVPASLVFVWSCMVPSDI